MWQERVEKINPCISLQPMSNGICIKSLKTGFNTGGAIQYVWLYGIIGIFVLLLACINFMNLSNARSEKSVRKRLASVEPIGSLRSQLISQFFGEITVDFPAFCFCSCISIGAAHTALVLTRWPISR